MIGTEEGAVFRVGKGGGTKDRKEIIERKR
jgi:hypothetical protein